MIFHLWRFSINRWIACNEFVYGKPKKERLEKRETEVNFQVTMTFLLDQVKIRNEDKLVDIPKETRLKHTWEQKKRW
jgi:hypothetical protein